MTEAVPTKRSWGRRFLILTTAVLLAVAGWFVSGESETLSAAERPAATAPTSEAHDAPGTSRVLATVNDIKITEDRVLDGIRGQLLALERQRHALIEAALRDEIRSALVADEAAERGVEADALLETEVATRATKLPADQVAAFYEAQKKQAGGRLPPKADIETDIRRYLALEAFHDDLHAKAAVHSDLEPFRVEVAAAGPAKGPASAPVTLVVFSDFECPYCSRILPVLEETEKAYGERVRIVFRQFPLEQLHPNARRAGLASLCAHEQGRFWPMHDALFADQRNLGSGLDTIAGRIGGLDLDAFRACLDDARFDDVIRRDLVDGQRLGVTGTPALFVNGRFFNGVVPFDQLAEVIDEELAG